MLNSPYKIYQQSSVQTASGPQLLIMLYEGAIRFTKGAIEDIRACNYEAANKNLNKAQMIVHELIASLNFDYDISKNLVHIYEYMLHLLIQANVKKDPKVAQEALGYLEELRDAWKQAAREASSNSSIGMGAH